MFSYSSKSVPNSSFKPNPKWIKNIKKINKFIEKRRGKKNKEFCSIDIISKRKCGLGEPLEQCVDGKLIMVVFSAT